MMSRLFKYVSIAIGVVVALAVVLIAAQVVINSYFPPTYEATATLPDSDTQVIVQLVPMHAFLGEYRRSLVLRKSGVADVRVEMFPDTGGYSRTQLYRRPDGTYVVRGFFDSAKIDLAGHRLITEPERREAVGMYIGAFDHSDDRQWQFLDANQSPEQPLVASGGG
jgi:hypothetical protein